MRDRELIIQTNKIIFTLLFCSIICSVILLSSSSSSFCSSKTKKLVWVYLQWCFYNNILLILAVKMWQVIIAIVQNYHHLAVCFTSLMNCILRFFMLHLTIKSLWSVHVFQEATEFHEGHQKVVLAEQTQLFRWFHHHDGYSEPWDFIWRLFEFAISD